MNTRDGFVVLVLFGAGAAVAQDSGLSVSVGARAWYTEWTTFSYLTDANGDNVALTQVSADNKLVLVPVVSARYGNFVGSLSVFPSTTFTFSDGNTGTREEFDANIGYAVLPGLAVTLGYKKISQRDATFRYEPYGPVLGVIGNASLGGPYSLYGSLGVGRLRTKGSDDPNVVQFKADYRLTEVGLAYTLNSDGPVRRWTFTAGYRIQVISSKDAFESPVDGSTQDGRDTTQGFSIGVIATF